MGEGEQISIDSLGISSPILATCLMIRSVGHVRLLVGEIVLVATWVYRVSPGAWDFVKVSLESVLIPVGVLPGLGPLS